jgi:hypothetical protein
MSIFARKSGVMPGLVTTGYIIFAVPVGLAVILALWLAAMAAYENVKFVRCTDQLLFLIRTANEDANLDLEFGEKAGEDLIDDFVRRAQLLSVPVNSWDGALRAQIVTPPIMRIETEVPVSVCRRLAAFFGKNAGALKLQKIEAREDKGNWLPVYDAASNSPMLDYRVINTACGYSYFSTFALTLRLR